MEKLNLDQLFQFNNKNNVNHKFSLKNALQEILYSIDNWINERSGWIVKLIKS